MCGKNTICLCFSKTMVVEFERLNFEKKQKYLQNHNEICQHCGGDQMSNFIFLILLLIF